MIEPINPNDPISKMNISPEMRQNILEKLPPEIGTKIQEAIKTGDPNQIAEVVTLVKDYLRDLKGSVANSGVESGRLQATIENSPFMQQAATITDANNVSFQDVIQNVQQDPAKAKEELEGFLSSISDEDKDKIKNILPDAGNLINEIHKEFAQRSEPGNPNTD